MSAAYLNSTSPDAWTLNAVIESCKQRHPNCDPIQIAELELTNVIAKSTVKSKLINAKRLLSELVKLQASSRSNISNTETSARIAQINNNCQQVFGNVHSLHLEQHQAQEGSGVGSREKNEEGSDVANETVFSPDLGNANMSFQSSDVSEFVTYEEEHESLWAGWDEFLRAANLNQDINEYSPEKNGVIECGNGVHRRDSLPDDLFQNLQTKLKENFQKVQDLSQSLRNYIDDVLDAEDLQSMRQAVKAECKSDSGDLLEFVKGIFKICADIYEPSNPPLTTSETNWNFWAIWAPLKECASYLNKAGTSPICVIPGETQLHAMSRELAKIDKHQSQLYYADGIIRLRDIKGPEVCILETSNAYNKADTTKIAFDHIKGMFGALAMLSQIADTYKFGTFEALSAVKVHFLHAHGTALRHWVLYSPKPSVYLFCKLSRVECPSDIESKADEMLPFLYFFMDFMDALKSTTQSIQALKDSHQQRSRLFRHRKKDFKLLNEIVCPTIVKITEKRHAVYVKDEAPFSSPNMTW
ncbi:hypothetical protein EC973_000050 [Apophysomyces ossiformis]|uniref:Uncharacterized protein n=1 Tax=Apophysomyces ossiformis TaxID=679940 RepID=A0A8H7BYB6_9FUNG|nr:hypothetical protein EC973_000050 [Apophysomyces ossiformis]